MTRYESRWDRLDGMLPPRRRRSLWNFGGGWGWVWVLVAVGLLIAVPLITILAGDYYERETVTTEVVTKERVCSSDGSNGISCKYMIFTEDGTFEITDSIFGTFRFNSSDVYGRIREGHTYRITSFGWRVPYLSMYPNVEKVEEVTP